jgi:hypothetical protein
MSSPRVPVVACRACSPLQHYPARIRIRVLDSAVFFAGCRAPFHREGIEQTACRTRTSVLVLQPRDRLAF